MLKWVIPQIHQEVIKIFTMHMMKPSGEMRTDSESGHKMGSKRQEISFVYLCGSAFVLGWGFSCVDEGLCRLNFFISPKKEFFDFSDWPAQKWGKRIWGRGEDRKSSSHTSRNRVRFFIILLTSQDASQICDTWFLIPLIIHTKTKKIYRQFNSNWNILYIPVFVLNVKICYVSRIKHYVNSNL